MPLEGVCRRRRRGRPTLMVCKKKQICYHIKFTTDSVKLWGSYSYLPTFEALWGSGWFFANGTFLQLTDYPVSVVDQ